MPAVTTSRKSKSLKRLSLLQSPTALSSPSSSSFGGGSPDVASKRVDLPDVPANTNVNHVAQDSFLISSINSPTTKTRSGQEVKNARRQSSIHYVSQDREFEHATKNVQSPADDERFSVLQNQRSTSGDNKTSEERKSMNRRSVGNASAAEEQPAPMPTTLAERHADLLRFIAQKESRCLELRSQLSTEEAELLALKRKWERIVSRGVRGGSSNASATLLDTDPSVPGAVLTGLKEGVQGVGRLLAQLSDIGTSANETAGHISNSSISTTATMTSTSKSSSTRLSQSSMSSLGMVEDEHECPSAREAFAAEMHNSNLNKRHSLCMPIRRRPYEPSSPASPSPPILTPQTPLSATSVPMQYSNHYQMSHTDVSRSSRPQNQNQSPSHAETRHKKRMSTSDGAFPPASSIPGVSVAAPFASFVDTLGKRLGQLAASSSSLPPSSPSTSNSNHTDSHSHSGTKRSSASLLFAALTSPTQPHPRASHVIDLNEPTEPCSPSLLDDDDGQWAGMVALSPDRPKLRPMKTISGGSLKMKADGDEWKRPTPAQMPTSARGSDADSEEWNW